MSGRETAGGGGRAPPGEGRGAPQEEGGAAPRLTPVGRARKGSPHRSSPVPHIRCIALPHCAGKFGVVRSLVSQRTDLCRYGTHDNSRVRPASAPGGGAAAAAAARPAPPTSPPPPRPPLIPRQLPQLFLQNQIGFPGNALL